MPAATNRSSGLSAERLPTGAAGRRLAAALLLLVLGLLWLLVEQPLHGLYAGRAALLDSRLMRMDRMQALADSLPALRRRARAAAADPSAAVLIEGDSDAVAGAALQERVQQMASGLGITIASSESLPGEAASAGDDETPRQKRDGMRALRRVGVRIAVTAPFATLVHLVAAIERASPALLIDDLQLHGSRLQVLGDPPVEAALTVLAYRRAGASEAAADPGQGGDPGQSGAP